jgi:hypothetical protein
MTVVTTEKLTFPLFVFVRKIDIEREGGFILAGRLYVDVSKIKEPDRRQKKKVIAELIEMLAAIAQDGMDDDALIIAWADGRKPANAVDVDDEALMQPWRGRTTHVEVRVGHGDVDSASTHLVPLH